MLGATKEKLEDVIVRLLADRQAASVETLYSQLSRQKRSYSLQALYKELRKLERQGVLVKAKGLFSLRLSWILTMTDLVDRAYCATVESPFPSELLPGSEKRMRWKFSSLLHADNFYMQVFTKLLMTPAVKSAYTVMDHPWFLFVHAHHETNHQKILQRERKNQYIVVENETSLDRAQMRIYDNDAVKYAFSGETSYCSTHSVITVVGEFLLHEKLPVDAKRGFDELYRKARSLGDLDYKSINRLCNMKGTSSVILDHEPEKARRLVKKLGELF